MKRLRTWILLTIAALAPSCAVESNDKEVRSSRDTLLTPDQTPVPCESSGNATSNLWQGDTVDLLTADALIACTRTDSGTDTHAWEDDAFGDAYAQHVSDLMGSALGTYQGLSDLAQRWANWRLEPARNCEPNGLAPGRTVDLFAATGVRERIPAFGTDIVRRALAGSQLRAAGLNLCVAQRLRESSPGASAGETLFLSDSEQRKMLHVIRERAQIAMMQYATLGAVFAAAKSVEPGSGLAPFTIGDLQDWAYKCWQAGDSMVPNADAPGCDQAKLLELMGDDFAAAIQLHITVAKEEMELLARSRSARTPSGVEQDVLAAREWGPRSWHQRLMAAAFGGDPTLAAPGDDPWPHFRPDTALGRRPAANLEFGIGGFRPEWSWPTGGDLPFYNSAKLTPQARKFVNLARRFDSLKLATDSSVQPGGECTGIDVDASTAELLKRVEADLRYEGCFGGEPCPASSAVIYPTLADYSDEYLLWRDYRIKPDDVRAAVTWLSESTSSGRRFGVCGGQNEAADTNAPVHTVGEAIVDSADADSPTGESLKLSPDVRFEDLSLEDTSPRYTRNAVHRIPDPAEVQRETVSSAYGLQLNCGVMCVDAGLESKRLMGAIPALVAVRQSLMRSLTWFEAPNGPEGFPGFARRADYYRNAEQMIETINAAVGIESAVVRPSLEQDGDASVPPYPNAPDDYLWEIEVSYQPGDAFWSPAPSVFHVVALMDHAHASNLARYPNAAVEVGGSRVTFDSLIGSARFGFGVTLPQTSDDAHGGTLRRFFGALPVNLRENGLTLVAVRVDTAGGPLQSQVIAANVALDGDRATEGQHFAQAGDLGGFVERQTLPLKNDPVKHAFDGFDLPANWVPPYNAELIGGASSESSSTYYLTLAKATAAEATAAVEKAIDANIQEAQSEAAKAEAVARARAGTREARDSMCGASNEGCEFSVVETTPNPAWYSGAPTEPVGCPADLRSYLANAVTQFPLSVPDNELGIECFVWEVTKSLYDLRVKVAQPVLDRIDEPTVPAFSEYEGGELQSAFIEQWRALRAPGEKLRALESTKVAAVDRVAVAAQALQNARAEVKRECSTVGTLRNLAGGVSFGSSGVSYSPAAAYEQQDKCDRLAGNFTLATKQAVSSQSDALAAVSAAVVGLVDAQAAIQQSSASVSRITNQAALAQKRFELEETLAERSLATSFGLARRYRSYDIWRAKVLLDSSRLYSLAARRAIEARYVTDLSTLVEDEPFVASPSTWADEVYEYDLSLPNSVGLAVGTEQPGSIYSNKVSDYVTNLEAFVAGYAVERPSAVASSDIEVVTLPGTQLGSPTDFDDGSGDVFYPERGAWSALCSDGIWRPALPSSPVTEACGKTCDSCGFAPGCSQAELDECTSFEQPSRVRLEFNLDPWGRVNTFISNEPFGLRHNGRWGQLAVNLVGTGIKQCELANDPLGCYGEGFVRYNLSHVGDAWLTNYDGDWFLQNVPQGRVEGGKALAAELWLDPLQDGWSTPYIGAVSRTEFALRPLSGAYALELEVRPELNLERIERVQILVGSTYWVRQD